MAIRGIFWSVIGLGLCLNGASYGGELEEFDFSGGCAKDSEVAASAEGGCKESQTGLVWGPLASDTKTYDEAVHYCHDFTNGRWGEWKLPRLKDMKRAAALGVARTNIRKGGIFDFFWVKDYGSGSLRHVAQLVEDESAEKESSDRAATICVRQGVENDLGCVTPETRYFITADGGCLYKKTKLAFSQRSAEAVNLTQAGSYCADLIEGGKDDWRLPQLEELATVAWDGAANRHFKFNVNGDFWTATKRETSEMHDAFYPHSDPRSLPTRYKIRSAQLSAYWVNLLTGIPGSIKIGSSVSKYYYSGFPMSDPSDTQTYDVSSVRASVVCARP